MKTSHSEKTDELMKALSKAQFEMKPAVFDKVNPHFKSAYASLNSIKEALRKPLADNGLSYNQLHIWHEGQLFVRTRISHGASDQWIEDFGVPVKAKDDTSSPAMGSGSTYAKRYGLSAMFGVVSDADDDGVIASTSNGETKSPTPKTNFPVKQPTTIGPQKFGPRN